MDDAEKITKHIAEKLTGIFRKYEGKQVIIFWNGFENPSPLDPHWVGKLRRYPDTDPEPEDDPAYNYIEYYVSCPAGGSEPTCVLDLDFAMFEHVSIYEPGPGGYDEVIFVSEPGNLVISLGAKMDKTSGDEVPIVARRHRSRRRGPARGKA